VVVDASGEVLARQQFANSAGGYRELKVFARRWRQRSWAVEGCNGVGKYLAQRLVFEGETVFDVSTRRAALVRVYAGGDGRKTDDTDAESIALVGLHTDGLPQVRPDEMTVKLRLLSNRRDELVSARVQAVCRIHRDLVVLLPGGSRSGCWPNTLARSSVASDLATRSASCAASCSWIRSKISRRSIGASRR
jgi:transposase